MKVNLARKRGDEGPEVEQSYNSTLSLTSDLDGVGGYGHVPAGLRPIKTPCTHCGIGV